MKILVLNIEYPPTGGGASPFCKDISELYIKNGNEVDVITMHHSSLPQYEMINGVNVYRVFSKRKLLNMSSVVEHIIFIYSAMKLLNKLVTKNQKTYDVCHCHFLIPTGILAIWAKAKYNLPYIVTIHGSDVPGYNPDRFQFIHRFTKPILNKIIRSSIGVISPSNYLKDLLKSNIPLSLHDKLTVIPYCYHPHESEYKKEKIILSSGRLLRRKGFHTLINAVSHMDTGYTVHILGDGPMMQELRETAQRSKTEVVLHGWVNNQSPIYHDLLSKAEIFCLVSSHENSSLSLMEAMDYQCAIITSDQSGAFEMIKDVGVCIAYDDVNALTKTINDLTTNPSKCKHLGIKAKQKLIEKYHPDTVCQSYLGIMKSSSQ